MVLAKNSNFARFEVFNHYDIYVSIILSNVLKQMYTKLLLKPLGTPYEAMIVWIWLHIRGLFLKVIVPTSFLFDSEKFDSISLFQYKETRNIYFIVCSFSNHLVQSITLRVQIWIYKFLLVDIGILIYTEI